MVDWTKYEGIREVIAFPDPEEFKEIRFPIPLLLEATQKSEILYRGWPFVFYDSRETKIVGDSIQTIADLTEIRRHEHFEMWVLKQSGLFMHKSVMSEETYKPHVERGKILGYENTIYHISEAIGSIWHLYTELGVPDKEKITIKFIYKGTKDRNLVVTSPSRLGFMGNQICEIPVISIKRSLPLEDWRASSVDIAGEVCTEIFLQFQWTKPNLNVIRELANKLLRRELI